ncbi:hypothetical protein H105_08427, partial [Trichophyton soudanense CBS 452.61]
SRLHGPATFLGLILDIPFSFHLPLFFPLFLFCQGRDPAPFSLPHWYCYLFFFHFLSPPLHRFVPCVVCRAPFSPIPLFFYCTSTTLFNKLTPLVLLRVPINILIPLSTCVSPSDVVVVHFAGSQNGD